MGSIKQYFRFTDVPVYMHIMGWFGKPPHINHPKANYVSDDAAVVARQMAEIQNWGFDGVMISWYGDGSSFRIINRCAHLLCREAERRGMKFGVNIEHAAIVYRPNQSVSTTDEFLQLVRYVEDAFISSPAYMRHEGKPLIFEFGMETLTRDNLPPIEWDRVLTANPDKHIVHRNISGFSTPGAGSYGWIDHGLPYLKDYYVRAKTSSQTKLCFGSIFKGFDNRKLNPDGTIKQPEEAVWSGVAVKVIPENKGQTLLDTITLTNDFHEQGGRLAGVFCNTYNDHEEGTGVEGGVASGTGITIQGNQNALESNPQLILKPMFR